MEIEIDREREREREKNQRDLNEPHKSIVKDSDNENRKKR